MKSSDFVGTTLKIADQNFFDSHGAPFRSYFFQPFKSTSEGVGRITSIVTDAPLLVGLSAFAVVVSAWELGKAIGNFFTGDFYESKENLLESGSDLIHGLLFLALAITSPLVNTVDLIGSIATSIATYLETNESSDDIIRQPGLR